MTSTTTESTESGHGKLTDVIACPRVVYSYSTKQPGLLASDAKSDSLESFVSYCKSEKGQASARISISCPCLIRPGISKTDGKEIQSVIEAGMQATLEGLTATLRRDRARGLVDLQSVADEALRDGWSSTASAAESGFSVRIMSASQLGRLNRHLRAEKQVAYRREDRGDTLWLIQPLTLIDKLSLTDSAGTGIQSKRIVLPHSQHVRDIMEKSHEELMQTASQVSTG